MDAQAMNFGMGTVMAHRAFGRHAEEALRAVRREAKRLEQLLSRFIPRSDISRVNRSAGIRSERVSDDTYEVLSNAVEFSRNFGLFDVTVGPLVALWNNAEKTCRLPEDSDIIRVLPLVDYTDLLLDPSSRTVGLTRVGQSIDLGGIGKGYAGDKFVEVFRNHGVSSAYTNLGGNVVVMGTKPDGSPWCVGIQHPRQEDGLIGLVSVVDKAVVTSGDYRRNFVGSDGKMYHHILDPSTGYPAESGLVSATVVANSSMAADALSTMLFVAGLDKGVELLESFPGTEAVLIDTDLAVHVTRGLEDCFQAGQGIRVSVLS